MKTDVVAEFYDDFRDRRMLAYRLGINRRLRLANRFVSSQIVRDSRILEVGCGIGLTTRVMARKANRGRVWALDLSRKNVELAQRIARQGNIEWTVLDVLEDWAKFQDWVSEPIDCIVLVDVLEHIPEEKRPLLFERLLELSSPDVRVILTFPSAEYQRYLYREQPSELQPIDEEISVEALAQLARRHDLSLVFWAYRDAWLTGQYIHAVLSRGHGLVPIRRFVNPYWISLRGKIAARVRGLLAWYYRD